MGKTGEVTARGGAKSDWTEWQAVAGLPALSADVLAETLDGGQAFRWQRVVDDAGARHAAPIWQGVWSTHVAQLRRRDHGRIDWRAPSEIGAAVAQALPAYLGVDRDFAACTDALPWRSDAHLARCVAAFPGLRILRQPFGETLLGFLCSATKQIVQIKQMVALLATRHGAPICRVSVMPATLTTVGDAIVPVFHRLPTWPELARVPEAELRACLLGFRARYIAETAKFLAAHAGWLEETEQLPYAAAKARLCSLPGVGEKVADCVLLFGAGRLEAFPVDVWILKTMARRYGLEDWRPVPLSQFGRVHFGPLAGFAQQFLFAWERAQKRKPDTEEQTNNPAAD